ncbi:hypothetical protein ALI144C_15595 [Actinosynnema sp. ALI-1.44]|uniref:aldo/keto reductase n=1 Tax=Actinosynnema sp. ALI-1.44 TaxID=1933779 RepID=UPI00097BC377|nr:aldo/keto reductase [Actinosynnema sp. ALI-1.44]ONI84117.1 hypothetical protein ALI144C_15595 [Actinosynnema sp. ALI-1.44]
MPRDLAEEVATQIGATPAQVALAWTLLNPAVTSPIIGARTTKQVEDNVGALGVRFDDSHVAALAKASVVELGFPHEFMKMPLPRAVVFGDLTVQSRG